jgi:hypothetical protein
MQTTTFLNFFYVVNHDIKFRCFNLILKTNKGLNSETFFVNFALFRYLRFDFDKKT